MGLVSELRRRNVLRMLALYIVAAWLIMQVAEVIIGLANLPQWIGPSVLALLAVGFPIALIFSWFYELTPEGISLEKDVARGESITRVTGRRLDFLVISLLCAAVILFAYDKWWVLDLPEQSIAVLPFENMSDDPGQEYFSDGLSEELLNLLAKVPALRVTSRSSAFAFKGQNIDISTIAQKLNVTHILVGSVRKSSNKVRITAQLIEARSDTHLWSETYDRELKDIFVIQDEISGRIVQALKIALGTNEHELITKAREPTEHLEAYDLYLRARSIAQARTPESLARSVSLIKESLEIDPLYAESRGFLATLYFLQKAYTATTAEESDSLLDLAEHTAVQALVLDENLSGPRAILAVRALYRHEWQLAEENFKRAVAVAPNDSQVRRWYSRQLMWLGYLEEALIQARAAQRLNPISAVSNGNLGLVLALLDKDTEAKKYSAIARELGLNYFFTSDIMVDLGNGRLADAAKAWTAGLEALGHDSEMVTMVVEASKRPEMISSTLEYLDALGPEAEPVRELGQALLLLRQYEAYLSNLEGDWFLMLWCPLASPIRQLPSFQAEVTKAGMLDYWKVRGWPDLCHPSDEGFVCD